MHRNAFVSIIALTSLLFFFASENCYCSDFQNETSRFSTISSSAFSATLQADMSESPVYSIDDEDAVHLFQAGTLWALPPGCRGVSVFVESSSYRQLSNEELDIIDAETLDSLPSLAAATPVMKMRGISLTSIAINPVQPSPSGDGFVFYESVQFSLSYDQGGATPIRPLPRAFYEVMRPIISNLDEIAGEPDRTPEPYLIITPPAYQGAAIDQFVYWKEQRGHEVGVVTTETTGTSSQSIRSYLQELYDTDETQPVINRAVYLRSLSAGIHHRINVRISGIQKFLRDPLQSRPGGIIGQELMWCAADSDDRHA